MSDIEKIKIIDSLGQEFTLPKTFELRSEPLSKKSSLLGVAFVHGAKDVSDGMYNPRIVTVSGKIWASSDYEYNEKWDAIAEHLIKENIRIQNRGRQINCKKVQDISHDYPSNLGYHYGEVGISFLCLDPFWYSANAVQKQFSVTGSPYQFQFDVGGKVETYPLIIITNSDVNSDFTLKNITDDGREFEISDSGAVQGTEIQIDCKEGTVVRDGETNLISVFSGLFLRLLGGRTNQFEYTGANCNITFQYKNAWI